MSWVYDRPVHRYEIWTSEPLPDNGLALEATAKSLLDSPDEVGLIYWGAKRIESAQIEPFVDIREKEEN